jgi:hypothetical protein
MAFLFQRCKGREFFWIIQILWAIFVVAMMELCFFVRVMSFPGIWFGEVDNCG